MSSTAIEKFVAGFLRYPIKDKRLLLCLVIAVGVAWLLSDPFPGSLYLVGGSLLLGGLFAWFAARGRREAFSPNILERDADLEREHKRTPIFGPDMQIQNLPTITGHPVGIVIIVGLVLILMRGVPESFPFLLGSIVLGVVIGAVLWWRHR